MKRLVVVLLALAACRPESPTGTNRGEVKLVVPGGSAESQTAWDFGDVKLGTSRSVDIEARNTGLDTATMHSVSFDAAPAGAYFVRNAPASLEAGASATFSVTYSPTKAEEQTGRLVLDHDGESADAVLALRGVGTN